ASSTLRKTETKVDTNYQLGIASGVLATDAFGSGGFQVANMSIVLADFINDNGYGNIERAPFDGIMGVAWPQSQSDMPTPMAQIFAAVGPAGVHLRA
ncbi:hypothetical protein AAVH_42476, partial [Aphelenchoides avenae]